MNCQTCGYPLWNIEARVCPECGAAFAPSQFSFAPGSVRFCCPGCDQAYYGTDALGHLVPRRFACVRCARQVEMDEMVLRPAIGAAGAGPMASSIMPEMPWLERERYGLVRAWFKTAGRAMTAPGDLMAAVPESDPGSRAFGFALMNLCLYFACGAVPGAILGMIGGFGNPGIFGPAADFVLFVLGSLVLQIVGLYIWFRLTHALLRLFGGAKLPEARTWQALGYGSAAGALSAVPFGCFASIGSVWWLVAAIIMLGRGHRCSGGQAAFATILAGLIGLAPSTALGIYQFARGWSNMMATTIQVGVGGTRGSLTPLGQALTVTTVADGRWPAHAVLLLESDQVSATDFTLDGVVDASKRVAGAGSLEAFAEAFDGEDGEAATSRAEARQAALAAAAAFPDDCVGHRVGDWMFVYHGQLPSVAASPFPLWLAVTAPTGGGREGLAKVNQQFQVLSADGSTRFLPQSTWPRMIKRQNELRADLRLPPLPTDYAVWCDSEVLRAGP